MKLEDPFRYVKVDKRVTLPAVIVLLAIFLPISLSRDIASKMITSAFNWTTIPWGWAYLLFCLFCFFVLLYWAVGRYGTVKLGGRRTNPIIPGLTGLQCCFVPASAAGL